MSINSTRDTASPFDVDEYGGNGAAGYGLSVELVPSGVLETPPPLTHLLCSILRQRGQPAHRITNFTRAKHVLTWLAQYRFAVGTALPIVNPSRMTEDMRAQQQFPGFGHPGTDDWVWQGTVLKGVSCPPLGGPCIFTLLQATPPGVEWNPVLALELVNAIARQAVLANSR